MDEPTLLQGDESPSVTIYRSQTGCLRRFRNGPFPSMLSGWDNGLLDLPAGMTHYGFVVSQSARLLISGREFELEQGMYFSAPGGCIVEGPGAGIVASRLDYTGLFQLGGPIEQTGRLRYIDGCSDTLLIGPPVLGDPCLNLLHIPANTNQTSHTHPSERLGVVAKGSGVCKTPNKELELQTGTIFSIDAEGIHSFNTQNDSMLVIAWHPDSDCGPSHADHPMINRTIVDGISAAQRLELEQEIE